MIKLQIIEMTQNVIQYDFVKRIFRTIYQRLSSFLQGISDKIFGSVKDDLEIPVDEE